MPRGEHADSAAKALYRETLAQLAAGLVRRRGDGEIERLVRAEAAGAGRCGAQSAREKVLQHRNRDGALATAGGADGRQLVWRIGVQRAVGIGDIVAPGLRREVICAVRIGAYDRFTISVAGRVPLCQRSCRPDRIGTSGGADIRKWLDTDKRIKTG